MSYDILSVIPHTAILRMIYFSKGVMSGWKEEWLKVLGSSY